MSTNRTTAKATAERAANGRFLKGNKAARNRFPTTRETLLRAMRQYGERHDLNDPLQTLIDKLMEQALAGDGKAMEILLARVLPAQKAAAEPIRPLPEPLHADALTAMRQVEQHVAEGTIDLHSGRQLASLVAQRLQIQQAQELEQRLEALERLLA